MRQGPHQKRGRGRGNRRPNTPNRNQTFDSNGPDVRIRGNAHQVYEKYLNLGRDASASGDRVLAESYFQHADHYYRIVSSFAENEAERRERANGQQANGNGREWNEDEEERDETRGGEREERRADRRPPREREDAESGAQPASGEAEMAAAQPAGAESEASEEGSGESPEPRRRGRPRRAAAAEDADAAQEDGIRRTLRMSRGEPTAEEANPAESEAPRPRRRRRAASEETEQPTVAEEDGAAAAS